MARWLAAVLAVVALAAMAACSSSPPTAPNSAGGSSGTDASSAPPAIVAQPQSQIITAGGTATLSVEGTSSAPIHYQWYAGASGTTSSPIAGATSSNYTTPVLMSTASFWARLSDSRGVTDSATATITVTAAGVPPTITTQPASQTVPFGQSAELVVTAAGTAPLTYKWYDGASGTTTKPIAGATAASYTTVPMTTAATYWVRVSNAFGAADSTAASLSIAGTAPSIDTQPQSQTINAGQTATLSVTATGSAPLNYQWYVGTSGSSANPIGGATSAAFATPALTSTTSYWVRVSNAFGGTDSTTATVSVAGVAPTITSQPQSQTIASGQTATLSVGATGTAPLGYQWYVGSSGATGAPIGGATSPSYTTPVLTTTTSYWVRVSNARGTADSSSATVSVTPPPPPPPPSGNPGLEDQVLTLINQRRAAGAVCGGVPYGPVGPLSMNGNILTAARGHSEDMATRNYFSHTSLDGRTFDQRMSSAGYGGASPWGENIAAGYSTAQAAVNGWMASPGHCQNIMNGSFKSTGIGYAFGAGSTYGHYWTQDFGGS